MESGEVTIRVAVPRSQLVLFVALIESYEELGVVRVTQPKGARADVYVPRDHLESVLALFERLTAEEGILVKVIDIL